MPQMVVYGYSEEEVTDFVKSRIRIWRLSYPEHEDKLKEMYSDINFNIDFTLPNTHLLATLLQDDINYLINGVSGLKGKEGIRFMDEHALYVNAWIKYCQGKVPAFA